MPRRQLHHRSIRELPGRTEPGGRSDPRRRDRSSPDRPRQIRSRRRRPLRPAGHLPAACRRAAEAPGCRPRRGAQRGRRRPG